MQDRKRLPVYAEDPFFEKVVFRSKEKQVIIGQANAVRLDTGEVSTMGIIQQERVDNEKFIKVYEGAIMAMTEISKPALKLFTFMVDKLPYNDHRIIFNPVLYADELERSPSYVSRLIRELAEKRFIAKSTNVNEYFINLQMVCKGNRLIIMREYIKTGKDPEISPNEDFDKETPSLPLKSDW